MFQQQNSIKLQAGEENSDYIHIIRVGTFKEHSATDSNFENMDDKWRESAPINNIENSSWIRIFRAFDVDHDGFIQCKDMQQVIRDSTYSFGFDHYELQKMSLFLEMREGKPIDFTDFCYLMSKCKGYKLREFLFTAAMSITPKPQRIVVFSKLQRYKCLPPPIFMLLVSIIQLIFYIYYVIDSKEGVWSNGPIPTISELILNPRHFSFAEFWRFFTYPLINIGIFHVIFNIFIQIFIGIPMEICHGFSRVFLIYLFGVIFGAMMHLAMDPGVFLMGGAAGSFAILASHLVILTMNLGEMEGALKRVVGFAIFGAMDLMLAIYQRFYMSYRVDKVSFYGPIGGLFAGIFFTFILLKHPKSSRLFTVSFWISLVLAFFYMAVCITLIIAPNYLQH
ncbi:unnamed protein product [Caenorhabditis angaria]|uniref:EF-hand domain-containing protein n=1 Tax=Caenorhabditis angaria TaxID=860376 RepID=A0A9P1ILY0_9PELO|nr:unnamed protein product [Caenorhabditis angaria]